MPRHAYIHRKTNETEVTVSLDLDGQGDADVRTGIGFYDHLCGHTVCST
jgi:imidazoleglycerol-phosphate dehydratase